MKPPLQFVFADDVAELHASQAARVARVPAGVRGKRELLTLLARQLQFPSYFGHNWDALFDCLSELTDSAMIIHEGLPLRTAAQRRSYLAVLRDVPTVRPVFPASSREQVLSLLSSQG
jgi:RNAse (barnase) inhibitor barstar